MIINAAAPPSLTERLNVSLPLSFITSISSIKSSGTVKSQST
jgi:hypothetical protein